MTLSTIGKDNGIFPDCITCDFTYKGFVFINYKSRKGERSEHHEYAALNFFWPQLERQVRIEGKVEKLDENMSDIYFSRGRMKPDSSPNFPQVKNLITAGTSFRI
jgi:pyridoxamine 5'-phosphate oxidase